MSRWPQLLLLSSMSALLLFIDSTLVTRFDDAPASMAMP